MDLSDLLLVRGTSFGCGRGKQTQPLLLLGIGGAGGEGGESLAMGRGEDVCEVCEDGFERERAWGRGGEGGGGGGSERGNLETEKRIQVRFESQQGSGLGDDGSRVLGEDPDMIAGFVRQRRRSSSSRPGTDLHVETGAVGLDGVQLADHVDVGPHRMVDVLAASAFGERLGGGGVCGVGLHGVGGDGRGNGRTLAGTVEGGAADKRRAIQRLH
mmetsp:Transcript_17225/g.31417  ORF Transcript_17225/g.31417 Transcript_17225/m.31417 type:complete len:214 (+) Transcript_17225:219-860(+)